MTKKLGFRFGNNRKPNIQAKGIALTDRGCKRQTNEDAVALIIPEGNGGEGQSIIAMVADGMGGHAGGEIASQMAVDTVTECYQTAGITSPNDLIKACTMANTKIWSTSLENHQYLGMGTTCSAIVCSGNRAFIVHIGDSRIYHFHQGHLYQLTIDHTLRNELMGHDPEQAKLVNRSILSRAMGVHEQVDLQLRDSIPVQDGDQFLLCSDGLYDLVADDEISALLQLDSLNLAAESLVALAKHRGGTDNISVVMIRIV